MATQLLICRSSQTCLCAEPDIWLDRFPGPQGAAQTVSYREMLAGWQASEHPNKGSTRAARRILVVEDEPLIGLSLKQSLLDWGAEVVWVQTDKAAYVALKDQVSPFDTLILDIDLGAGTTGFDIARFARRSNPRVGIIFSSGSPPDWMHSFGVAGAMFVQKPCTDAAMLTAVALVHSEKTEAA